MKSMKKYLVELVVGVICLGMTGIASANIVTNGDFESGNQGFLSDYTPYSLSDAESYYVTTNPRFYHGGATSYGDHTSGSGYMMAVNAATSANQLVWGQNVTLNINTDYDFSIRVSSWTPPSPANLIFNIGGISLGSVAAPSVT